MKKRIAKTMVMVSLFGMLAGSGSVRAEEEIDPDITARIEILNNGGDAEQKINAEIIAKFNEKYPNVEVVDTYASITDWGEYINGILTRKVAGTMPDIIYMGGEGLHLAASRNLLLPLDEYIEDASDESFQQMLTDVNPTVLNCLSYQDSIYAMPTAHNGKVLIYNKKIFDERGVDYPTDDWTWDELREAAKKLTYVDEDGTQIYGYSMSFMTAMFDVWPYIFGSEGNLTADWTKSNLLDPLVEESYQYVYDMIFEDGSCPIPEVGQSQNAIMASERCAMITEGSMFFRYAEGSEIADHIGICKVPMAPDGSGRRVAIFGALGFGISSECEYPELAWELIKMLASEERQAEIVAAGGPTPIVRQVAIDNIPYDAENKELWYDYLEDGKLLAGPVKFTEYNLIMQNCWQSWLSQTKTIHEALVDADAEITEAFSE